MIRFQKIILLASAVLLLIACKKDVDPVFIVPASAGAQVQLNGIAAAEPGTNAGNAVYLDLSGERQIPVLRSTWDLGFYCGSDFRVVLNNTALAGAKVLAKNSLTDVGAADTIGLTLTTSQFNPLPGHLAYFDNIAGDLTKTVIPAVSATDADNKVIILNRGTGGGIAARPWIKLRILRNAAGGYSLQYAGIQETSFRTIQIGKDAAYNFKNVSFENGVVEAEPEKEKWDLVWSYSVFESNFGAGPVPYNFSDLIAVRQLLENQTRLEAQLKQSIQQRMADASLALFEQGTVTWKRSKDSDAVDMKQLSQDNPDLVQRYSSSKPGSRRFLITANSSDA